MRRTPSQRHQAAYEMQAVLDGLSSAGASSDAVTADDFALRYARERFLKKYQGLSNREELTAKCIATFQQVESECRHTNNRIRSLAFKNGATLSCLIEARRKIRTILGRFSWDEWYDCCSWGPGATATLKADDSTPDQKMLEKKIGVSRRALPYARAVLSYDKHWFLARTGFWPEGQYTILPSEFEVDDSERGTTVDKDTNSRRWISIQQTMNLYLQKGCGGMIRRRLKRYRIDLDDQGRNQWLASVAQRTGLATIDLSSASDSIAFELVRFLLPEEWFQVLADLRHPSVTVEGSVVHLEKFSAMGNGATFELESLIFYALAWSVSHRFGFDSPIGVYGDDIIVDAQLSKALIALLSDVGFKVNVDKTFTEGRFYESCGKHYFDGFDVTPPLQKEAITDLASSIRAANRIFRFAIRMGGGQVCDPRFRQLWEIPANLALRYHTEWNRRRAERASESGRGQRVKPLPFPWGPPWAEDDASLLSGRPLRADANGRIYYDRLLFGSRKKLTQCGSLYAISLRKSLQVERASLGFVDLRGGGSVQVTRGKTWVPPDFFWSQDLFRI